MGDTIIIAIAIAVVLILCVIIGLVFYKKKNSNNKSKIKTKKSGGFVINDEFINQIILLFGGITNINKVEVENSRLKITVNDIYSADLEGLKKFSDSGVFVTGYTVKILFKYDSELIKKSIEERI